MMAAPPFTIAGVYSIPQIINDLARNLAIPGCDSDQFEAILNGNILANTIDPPKDMVPGGHFVGLVLEELYKVIGKTVNIEPNETKLLQFITKFSGGRTFKPVNRDQTHYIHDYLKIILNGFYFEKLSFNLF